MKILAGKNGRSRSRADKLLSQTGLLAILRKYGEVTILGINKKNGNIDVQVVCASCDSRKMQQIFSDISYNAKFDSFYSGVKDNEMLRKKFSSIHHVGMSKPVEGGNYSVDVWFVAPKEAKKYGGSIDVSRSAFYKLSRFNTSRHFFYALSKSGASKIIAYLLIVAFVFIATVGLLNFVFNGALGLGALSMQNKTLEEIDLGEQIVNQTENEEQAGTVTEETEPVTPKLPEGAYEGAFEEQLADFPDFPTDLPLRDDVEPADASTFIQESPDLPENCNFVNHLRIGNINDDVARLQMFLNFQGEEIYPEGIVSGWFGTLTRGAVVRFQEKYFEAVLVPWNIDKGTGFVGITTTAKINELCAIQKRQLPIAP